MALSLAHSKNAKRAVAVVLSLLVIFILFRWMKTSPAAPVATKPAATPAPTPAVTEATPIPLKINQAAIDMVMHPLRLNETEVKELRAQAKMSLASAYSAERAYFAEADRYTTDLKWVGWLPAESKIPYKLGFLTPFLPAGFNDLPNMREDPRRLDTDALIGLEREDAAEPYEYDDLAQGLRLAEYQSYCETGCSASADEFEVLLAVPLGDLYHVDVWLMNQRKELKLVHDGAAKISASSSP